jgi:hypothetical protein
MFLRYNRRFKDGKEHRYWNIVENKRCAAGKVVQRQVLYLGEINDGQREAWCQSIEALMRAADGTGSWRFFRPIAKFRPALMAMACGRIQPGGMVIRKTAAVRRRIILDP